MWARDLPCAFRMGRPASSTIALHIQLTHSSHLLVSFCPMPHSTMSTTTAPSSLSFSMTRANSSAQETDTLTTPMEELTSPVLDFKTRIRNQALVSGKSDSRTVTAEHPSPQRAASASLRTGPDWRSSSADDVIKLHQRRSTKDLIHMYESNWSCSDIGSARGIGPPSALSQVRLNQPLPSLPPAAQSRVKLPVRDSFRNLFSVFGVRSRSSREMDDIGGPPYAPIPQERVEQARICQSHTVETFSVGVSLG